MKKFIVIVVTLFFVLPAVTFAGSVTSKYDVTLGGYVKFDMGWGSQNLGPDPLVASRSSTAGAANKLDDYGNLYFYAGESRLNLLVNGPDAWGAKTGAFIEGDFRGASIGQTAGVFELRHAFMKFDWAMDSLLVGQYWNEWGTIYTLNAIGFNDLANVNKGARQPQIRWTHKFNKNFSFFAGLFSEYSSLNGSAAASANDDNARSLMPHYFGELTWKTDSCGKIGPWPLTFSLGGFYGQDRVTWASAASTKWIDDKVNSWTVSLKGNIPIIPEKKGDKAGALGLSGAMFYGQNSMLYNPTGVTPYTNGVGVNASAFAPKVFGGWGQLVYYFTDVVYISGLYSAVSNMFSDRGDGNFWTPTSGAASYQSQVRQNQQFIATLVYDVNPAVRLGLEYTRYFTSYGGYGQSGTVLPTGITANADKNGTMDSIRIGAFYFF